MDKVRVPATHTTLLTEMNPSSKGSGHTSAEAAKQFEALLVQEMLKSMWQTVPEGGLISGSNEEKQYRDMFNEQLALTIASGKGVGIKEVIQKDIDKLDKAVTIDKKA